jgi:NTE family protein
MFYDCVMEGGGTKIPGLVGALYGLENNGFSPSHLAGTSAGSIVASLRSAGYTPEQLKTIMLDLNFNDFLDGGKWGTKAWNLFKNHGIYKGDYFYKYIKDLLATKGVYTFGDLLSENPKDLENMRYRWKLKVFASDISMERLVTLPDDAFLYGMLPDDVEVAWAVRTSMSIPFFFYPVNKNGSYLVDGGLISNFPIWCWDSYNVEPKWPTFGLLLDEKDAPSRQEPNKIGFWPHEFFMAMFRTSMKANDRRFIRPDDFEQRTIKIPTLGIGTTDFNLSAEKKESLFHSGRKATEEFLKNWNFSDYVKWATKVRGIK